MTTDRRRAPRIDLSGLEWKLAILTALGGAYVALWFGLTRPTKEPPMVVAPPSGWTLATREAPITPKRVVQPRRIKTRSS